MYAEELRLEVRPEHAVHQHAMLKARPRLLPVERQPLRDTERSALCGIHARGAQLAAAVLHCQLLSVQHPCKPRAKHPREGKIRVRGAVERLHLEVARGGNRCVAQPHGCLAVVGAPADVRAPRPDTVEHARVRRRRGEEQQRDVREVLEEPGEEGRLERGEVRVGG